MNHVKHLNHKIDMNDELDVGDGGSEAVGAFEACGEHRGPDPDGPCTGCGWLGADHTASLAVVIEVRRALARAA